MHLNQILTILGTVPKINNIEYGSNWVRFKVSNQDGLKYITDGDNVHYNLINRSLHINNETILVR